MAFFHRRLIVVDQQSGQRSRKPLPKDRAPLALERGPSGATQRLPTRFYGPSCMSGRP